MFRIRDILARIRILVSVPTTNGSGSGSCPFVSDIQDANKKLILKKCLAYYFSKVHLHHS
jgi:hypothetical protein